MKSDDVVINESGSQNNEVLDANGNPKDFYIEKSDLEGRVVTYIFAIIVLLGFSAMVAMGIFAFVL